MRTKTETYAEDEETDEHIRLFIQWYALSRMVEKEGEELRFFDFYGENSDRSSWIFRELQENDFDEDFNVDIRKL
jgi:hypothetical protein